MSVEIGKQLKQARQALGMSIEEIAEKIHIDIKYVEAIERGRFDLFPNPTYLRSYIRIYAKHVGLNPQLLLKNAGLSFTGDHTHSTQRVQTRAYRTLNHTNSYLGNQKPYQETGSYRLQETKRYQMNPIPQQEEQREVTRSNRSLSVSRDHDLLVETRPYRGRRNVSPSDSELIDPSVHMSEQKQKLSRTEKLSRTGRRSKVKQKKKASQPVFTGILIASTVLWVIAALGLVYLKVNS
ncbi:helix-turn-helix domain-containing protein [Thermoflavimicrobium dichotomicum]|uniref:Helix-turn-helix domain-containing protein n=1 Tax=Thermoflavimicrobium dichotomicum TaxID=46223 RepID=A0A1I3PS57_9BACL|nr:helix-turn-helix transcriptional regulator [Thermoflavimicrobium dichotomicum]SFJ24594.1 Helix-turn-helix domain-containing protein [Thermoflavimicrobium dichotomicum]